MTEAIQTGGSAAPAANSLADITACLACPRCRATALEEETGGLRCSGCDARYEVRDGIPFLIRPESDILKPENDRADFWNAGWEKRSAAWQALDRDGILAVREAFHAEMLHEAYPSVTDVGPGNAGGRLFLNIGCGGGQEGLLFAGYGARYLGVDISYNAARYTTQLIAKAALSGRAVRGEAEYLPVASDSIDFVYTNGVLHHTPNTQKALEEVRRVTRPGGTAMIGLYAANSVHFFTYRIHAFLDGCFTRTTYERWLHANTELDWKTDGRENRWTTAHTRTEFTDMLRRAGFTRIKIDQIYFQFKELPVLGRLISRWLPTLAETRAFRFGGILMATCSKG